MINSLAYDVEIFPNLFSITFVDLQDYLNIFKDCVDSEGKPKPLTECLSVTNIKKRLDEVKTWKKSTNKETMEKYANWKAQIKDFVVNLDPTTQYLFAQRILTKGGRLAFQEYAEYFSKEVHQQIVNSKAAIDDLNKGSN